MVESAVPIGDADLGPEDERCAFIELGDDGSAERCHQGQQWILGE